MKKLKLITYWKTLLLLLGMGMISGSISAQSVTLRGRVIDQKGQPLVGASVKTTGSTTTGINTDISGNFALPVTSNVSSLTVSYVGYITLTVPVKQGATSLGDIILANDATSLSEVVVVGYGTQRKRDVTGATVSVDAKTLAETPSPNFADALRGRVAGVEITATSARPGSPPNIRIRGNRTIGQGANSAADQPLLVVDGVPFVSGSLSDINPDNIKSMEILKDASSTAIYGSRGSGGVILITTNRGTIGKPVTTLTTTLGVRTVPRYLKVFNGAQYAQFKQDAVTGSIMQGNGATASYPLSALEQEGIKNGVDVDWQKYAYRTGINSDQNLSIAGGNETTTYNMGVGYTKMTEVIPSNDYTRYSVLTSIDHKLSKVIRVGLNMSNILSYRNTPGGFPAGGAAGVTPLVTPYDENGKLRVFPWAGAFDAINVNPLYFKENPSNQKNQQRDFRNFTSLYAEFKPIKHLTYKVSFGFDFNQTFQGNYSGGSITPAGIDQKLSTAWQRNNERYHYTFDNLLTYDNTFAEKHHVNFTGLFGIEKDHYQSMRAEGTNIPADLNEYYNLNLTTFSSFPAGNDNTYREWGLISQMARLVYSYDSRYVLTATMRGDGNSTLPAGNKWLYYPALSAAWNVTNEDFLKRYEWINNLKLRAGYGVTSNGGLNPSPYQTLGALGIQQYQFGNGAGGNTLAVSNGSIAVPNLRWQKTGQFNVGFEFGLFNNRLSGTIDAYSEKTTDIIMGYSNLPSYGGQGFQTNLASTASKGLELSLSSINLQNVGGFTWATDFNIAFARERITGLPNGIMADVNNALFVGSPLNVIYDVRKIGIWQISDSPGIDPTKSQASGPVYQKVSGQVYPQYPGQIRVEDVNNNGTIDNGDNQILGTDRPQYQGGITNRFTYKNFDLSFNINFRMGGLVIVQYLTSGGSIGGWGFLGTGRSNQPYTNYWTPTNPTGTFPQPNMNLQTYPFSSTTGYFNASYIKLRTVNLGYTLPTKIANRLGISSLRLFAQCLNPWIIYNPAGKASGGTVFDPETQSSGGAVGGTFSGNPAGSGGGRMATVGYGGTPITRDFVFGLNLKF